MTEEEKIKNNLYKIIEIMLDILDDCIHKNLMENKLKELEKLATKIDDWYMKYNYLEKIEQLKDLLEENE